MKKRFSMLCFFLCLCSLSSMTAFASPLPIVPPADDFDRDTASIQTRVRPIPTWKQAGYTTASFQNQRELWKQETKQILEQDYGQSVISITEDASAIRFYFQTSDPSLYENLPIEETPEEVMLVEYIKPESVSLSATASDVPSFSYYKSWSGMYTYQTKTADWINAASVSIGLFPGGPSMTLTSFILSITSAVVTNLPVRGISFYKYLYHKQVCSLLYAGSYVPYVQIGRRFTYNPRQYIKITETGEPVLAETKPGNNTGVDDYSPSGYEKEEKKPNFGNLSWMENKARECRQKGTNYYDCYN